MKKYILIAIMCVFITSYGEASPSRDAKPPHRTARTNKYKTKRTKVYGYDRARTVKKVRYLKGYDYYRYANRPSYLRMMGKAINGDRFWGS
ncbi:hypothetical protein WBG78_28240 [Chryseolinea sp. T2]|uniref:hypothetical protein n=1 Tax=Chryseolinea sp. T2 TaxID=3129255 RepID=UPI0030789CBC